MLGIVAGTFTLAATFAALCALIYHAYRQSTVISRELADRMERDAMAARELSKELEP